MTPNTHQNSFGNIAEALHTPEVTGFLTKYVPEFYASVATGHEDEARQLVRDSFRILDETVDTYKDTNLVEAAARIYREVFHKNDPEFWFTPIHQSYNRDKKPKMVTPLLSSRLHGRKVLDIGAGSGYLARQMQREGYLAEITDVLDYRKSETLHLPFKRMDTPDSLPHHSNEFDSALFFEVLHHVDYYGVVPLLKEARRVARRIVVVENPFGDLERPSLRIVYEHEDPDPTNDYLAMTSANQLKTLILMDYYVNIASKGIADMNIPFTFKSVEEWLKIFGEVGMSVVDMSRIGFFRNTLNRNFQVYFTLDAV